jgi:hypothetical protein
VFQSKRQIFAVFRRESGNAQLDSGQIDAFMFSESSAIYDFANYFVTSHLQDTKFDQAIRKQDAISAVDFLRERPENGADSRGIAQDLGGGNYEALPGAEHDRPASGERPGANLWALQVGKNGDWFFLFDSGGTQSSDILRVLGVGAMREIQPGNIHPGFQ